MSSILSQAHLLSGKGFENPAPPGGPISYGEQVYTSAGTYTWTAPEQAAWTNISIVLVSAGRMNRPGGGGSVGGSLAYGNNIPVKFGKTYTIVVGDGTTPFAAPNPQNKTNDSSFSGPSGLLVNSTPGSPTTNGPVSIQVPSNTGYTGPAVTGGGTGGLGGPYSNGWFGDGGGGAGGYTGHGGRGGGGTANPGYPTGTGTPGNGGGGGGGGGSGPGSGPSYVGGPGGGVGLHGQGPPGSGSSSNGTGGNGSPGPTGVFGGGAGSDGSGVQVQYGQPGGVRILWGGPPAPQGGTNRLFPSSNVS